MTTWSFLARVRMYTNGESLFSKLKPEKRERIIAAALGEFADKGYTGASMNVIAANAGVAKGSLFDYFGNKSGLFGYIYHMALTETTAYLRSARTASRNDEFFTRIEKLMVASLDFVTAHPDIAAVYYRITHTGDAPYPTDILADIHGRLLDFIRDFITEAIARHEIRSDIDPSVAAFLLAGILDRFLQAHFAPFLDPYATFRTIGRAESLRWIDELIGLYRRGMTVYGVHPKGTIS